MYKLKTFIALFIGVCMGLTSLQAAPLQHQQVSKKTITGKVLDEDNMPLMGATVQEVGTKNGVVTDFDGDYKITLTKENATLKISYIGYQTVSVAVKGQSVINVQLKSESLNLDQVVVVGYGKQKKESVTGAISTMKGKEITESNVANLSNALVGRIAGVSSTQASGEPGRNATTIRIRGVEHLQLR
jgi:putative outer membrane protein, probably involved in nutrient binding